MFKPENPYFTDANCAFIDIAHMLMELDEKGAIPAEMREAIWQHADNSLDVMALNVGAVAMVLASASEANNPGPKEVSKVSCVLASMAEQMHGWKELAGCFGEESDHA